MTLYRPRIAVTMHRYELAGDMCLHPAYTESVARAGGLPLVLPMLSDPDLYETAFELFDGFVLTGSEADVFPELYGKTPPEGNYSDPWRDTQDYAILRHAEATGKPVFGVCRGCQVMNVYWGGTLAIHFSHLVTTDIQHDHPDHLNGPPAHLVNLMADAHLATLSEQSRVWVNSLHRQVCDRVGSGLRVAARAEDDLIEAVEDIEQPRRFYAVQWHPEKRPVGPDPLSDALFAQLIEEARVWRSGVLPRPSG